MKALLLYNSKAQRGRLTGKIGAIVEIFNNEGITITPKPLDYIGNPFDGYEDIDLVVVCGGDGTINFVVNMMRAKGINPAIGVIPAGTANDFASAIGMRRGTLRAARQIATGTEHRVDCGVVNGKYFVNVFSFGVLTTTSQLTSDKEKQLVGKLAYVRVGIKDMIDLHSIPLTIEADSQKLDIDAAMCLVFNGNSAGQFKLAPDAKINDGMLDLLVLEYHHGIVTYVNMMRHLIGQQTHAVHHIKCESLIISSSLDEPTDVDGQPGPHFPMNIRCEAGALKIRC